MAEKDLQGFLKKIEQLNLIVKLIEKNPDKRFKLSNCNTHEDVIKLTSSWGFNIEKRWGEN